jgi:hypothetical protein
MKQPYYQTHEPPHCPTCDCADTGHSVSSAQLDAFAKLVAQVQVDPEGDYCISLYKRDGSFWVKRGGMPLPRG